MHDSKLHKSKAEASRLAEAFAAYLDETRLVFIGDSSDAAKGVERLFREDTNQALALYHTLVDRWSLRTTATAMGVRSHSSILAWNKLGISRLKQYVAEAGEERERQITPVSPTTANAIAREADQK